MAKDRKASGEAPRPPTVGKLHTLDAIRREAARLYRDARTGKFDPGDASKLGSILALMARLVEGSTLEARITALEKHLAEGDDR